ncbi:glycoside hydrolase family 15 protein [Halovivax sp.]|uniref:glycoside hydrolase family 15 protein n=1 Tax=Halovivax sp. TaxID=1935978 RepID=UPI0025C1DC44|nr:glycoside hydrolase family 15 protein [Halovivax sp.]
MTTAYHPIEAYGIVGNGETCALVAPDGSVDWYPVPHVESASAFAAVLDAERGGSFRIGPDRPSTSTQSYLDRTNVLRTAFETDGGKLSVVDFMPHVEIDVDASARALYRKVECTRGEISLEVAFEPRLDYARGETELERLDGRVHATGGGCELALAGDVGFRVDEAASTVTAADTLRAGDGRWFAVSHDGPPPGPAECERALEETVAYWREWAHDHDGSSGGAESDATAADHGESDGGGADEDATGPSCVFDGPWHDDVVRSGLALKLLSHAESGAIAAAPTTSLPEEFGGVRNWDYRFSWPRDAAFTVQALAHLGHLEEAGAYFEWFLGLCETAPEEIQPLYGLHGDVDLAERELTHLRGYRDSRPVRIGNAAAGQRQLDLYGELVLALAATVHHGWKLDAADWPAVRRIVDHVTTVWDRPDSGIWEVRSEPRHFVHSKVMCWVALDRAIAFAEANDWDAPLERWREVRAEIRRAVLERGYDGDRETFLRAFESDAVDAATLLLPLVGFLPFDDERVEGTVASVRDRLETDDGLVHRYEGEDGLSGGEGTFTLCSFWLVDVLALSGRVDEATALFETLLAYASPHGLYAEELDPAGADQGGVHRGNYPQAFSHVGLINSALYLGRVREPETAGPEPIGIWLGEGPDVPN